MPWLQLAKPTTPPWLRTPLRNRLATKRKVAFSQPFATVRNQHETGSQPFATLQVAPLSQPRNRPPIGRCRVARAGFGCPVARVQEGLGHLFRITPFARPGCAAPCCGRCAALGGTLAARQAARVGLPPWP
jgi:hypothetical protein